MKRIVALICLSAFIATGTLGCVFAVDRSVRNESKDTPARLHNLEQRVGQLEACQANCPLKDGAPAVCPLKDGAPAACPMAPPASCSAMPEKK